MADKKYPVFDYDVCVACGVCSVACPVSAIELNETSLNKFKDAFPTVDRSTCIGCGICDKNCPVRAIEMREAPEVSA